MLLLIVVWLLFVVWYALVVARLGLVVVGRLSYRCSFLRVHGYCWLVVCGLL